MDLNIKMTFMNNRNKMKYKPGIGWRHLGGSVYELDGLRIHVLGYCRFPDGEFICGNAFFSQHREMERMIKINGMNRKRGIMAWARNINEVNI